MPKQNLRLDIRQEWPMDSYLAAWKNFRQASDENRAIARHLISRPSWPQGRAIRVCDLGCGDGRLLEALVLECLDEVAAITLIDPDPDLLDEATRCLTDQALVPMISTHLATAEESFPECAIGHDIVLMVHVVYLLESTHLLDLLYTTPQNVALLIVFDHPESVFTTLWERTAPKYHARVLEAHKIIDALSPEQFAVHRSEFEARLPNPFDLPREDIRRSLLSMLCYSSEAVSDHGPWIKSVVDKYLDEGGNVVCRSVCYEIMRLK